MWEDPFRNGSCAFCCSPPHACRVGIGTSVDRATRPKGLLLFRYLLPAPPLTALPAPLLNPISYPHGTPLPFVPVSCSCRPAHAHPGAQSAAPLLQVRAAGGPPGPGHRHPQRAAGVDCNSACRAAVRPPRGPVVSVSGAPGPFHERIAVRRDTGREDRRGAWCIRRLCVSWATLIECASESSRHRVSPSLLLPRCAGSGAVRRREGDSQPGAHGRWQACVCLYGISCLPDQSRGPYCGRGKAMPLRVTAAKGSDTHQP